MISQRRTAPRLQFSLRGLLGFSALLAVVLGLTVWTRAPEIPLLAVLIALVVLVWRFTQVNRAGLVLSLIGSYVLGNCAIDWGYRGDSWAALFAPAIGSLVLGLAIVIFALAPVWKKKTIAVHMTCATAILALLVLWWQIVPPLGRQAARNESARQYLDTMVTFRALISELETIRATTGTYPANDDHWVAIRGAPLPKSEYGGRFLYQRYGQGETEHFQLSFIAGFFGDICMYDSSTPQRGVFMVPF